MSADVDPRVDLVQLATLQSVAGSRAGMVTVTLANVPMSGLLQGEFHRAIGARAASLAGLDSRAFPSFTIQRYSLDRTANVFFHRD